MGPLLWLPFTWLALACGVCPASNASCPALRQDEDDNAALGLLQVSKPNPPNPPPCPISLSNWPRLEEALAGLLGIEPYTGAPPVECHLRDGKGCPISSFRRGVVYSVFTGGETICLSGEAYRAQVVRRDLDKLIFYFQGGGACFDVATFNGLVPCLNHTATCTKNVHFSGLRGMLDGDNPKNPYKDHTLVILPYCSGDLFAGATTQLWNLLSPKPVVKVHGFYNAKAVLDWAAPQFPHLESLVLAGSSAGSLAVMWWSAKLLQTFQREGTRTVIIADSFMGASYPLEEQQEMDNFFYETWNMCDTGVLDPAMQATCNSGSLTLPNLWLDAMHKHPLVSFVTINSKEDIVQIFFSELVCALEKRGPIPDCELMTPGEYYYGVNKLLEKYYQAVNYQAFLVDGEMHTYVELPVFYTADPLSPFGNVSVGPIPASPARPKLAEWIGAINARIPLTCKYVCMGPSREVLPDDIVEGNQLHPTYCVKCLRNLHPFVWR